MNTHLFHRYSRFTLCLFASGLLAAPLTHAADIGHWTFNEGEGVVIIDHSGQGNHGHVIAGGPFVASPGGFAISLDGIDDEVQFGQPAILDFTSQAFTIEAWVKVDAPTQTGGNHGIFGKRVESWLLGFEIRFQSNFFQRFNFRFTTAGGAGAAETLEGNLIAYHHLLATRGASGSDPVQFYVNGVCVSTNNPMGQCDAGGTQDLDSQAVDVVAGAGSGNHLECEIDEIRVQDVRVDASQALALYNAGPSTAPSDPYASSSEVPVEDAFFATFGTQEGLTYELECTTGLVTPSWASTGAKVNGTGNDARLFDTPGAGEKAYRVAIK
jgi:hypothetical protein